MARRGLAIIFTLLGLAFVVSIGGLVLLYVMVGREPSVPSNATLTLQLGGDLAEIAPTDVVSYVSGVRTPTVQSVVDNLRKAKVDRRVGGVFLKLTGFSSPYWGKVQELRDALNDFRTSGKPVYAFLHYGGDRDYYLASAADKVYMLPSTTLDLAGVATYQIFLRGFFDKIGVYPDIHHVGEYKTAANQMTERGYTPEHREMDAALNRDLYQQIVAGVASGRHRPDSEVRTLIEDGPFLPEQARAVGLIDSVGYEDQALQALKDATGTSSARTIEGPDYSRVSLSSLGLNRGPRIGIIYAAGAIVDGKSGYDALNGATVGSETLIDAIRDAAADKSLRALVVRIDSPGGSVSASDAIWRELKLARSARPDRPIIASMSDLAASGGYYIATPAEAIVAQPATLTGSIGIFGGKYVTGGVYEKLGANVDAESIGRYSQINSPIRPYNADEVRKVEQQLRVFYDDFLEKVAESRGRTMEEINRLAQGRVWTGQQAKSNGLVDEIGGLDRAVAVAKTRAKIDAATEVELVTYPTPKTFYEMVSESMSGEIGGTLVENWMRNNLSAAELEILRATRGPLSLYRQGEALALMPFTWIR